MHWLLYRMYGFRHDVHPEEEVGLMHGFRMQIRVVVLLVVAVKGIVKAGQAA